MSNDDLIIKKLIDIDEKLDNLVTRDEFGEFKSFVSTQFDQQGVILLRLDSEMAAAQSRLGRVEDRLEGVEEHLVVVTERLDGVTERLDGVEEHLAVVTERLDGVTERLDGLTERFDAHLHDNGNRPIIA